MERKGAVDLTELAVGILILGIVVAIGSTILMNVAISQSANLPAATAINESIAAPVAGTTLGNLFANSITTCINATGATAVTIAPGNYTLSTDTVGSSTITANNHGNVFNTSAWKCTYSFQNTSDPRYALPNNASIGISEYGNWFKILVIVGVAGVILALIMGAFRNPGQGSGKVNY